MQARAGHSSLAPKAYLTGAEWSWATVYKDYIAKVQSGEISPGKPWSPHLKRGGMKDGFVTMSPYGPDVSDESKAKIEAYKTRMGWKFPWASSFGSEFNHDFHVSFEPDEIAKGEAYYNYELRKVGIDEL